MLLVNTNYIEQSGIPKCVGHGAMVLLVHVYSLFFLNA